MFDKPLKKRGFTGSKNPVETELEKSGRAIARKAAAEGIVLLKNDGVLPLVPGSRVALYGPGAGRTIKGGTGSGDVNVRDCVSIWQGMRDAGFQITSEDWIRDYDARYVRAREAWRDLIFRKTEELPKEDPFGFFTAYSTTPFQMPDGAPVNREKASADSDCTAFYILSRICGEGADRFVSAGDYYLTESEHQMLSDLCGIYENVVVVLNAGGQVDLSFLEEFPQIRALLQIAQPGMEGGHAFADVVSGKICPSGRLSDTWAYHYEDYPNAADFSHNNGCTDYDIYEEGIYVGYRYFDSFEMPVRYHFGEGLSYTTFSTALKSVEMTGASDAPEIQAEIEVRNTGKITGKETVQVYVSLPEGKLEKEYRRLAGFAKTGGIRPGETQSVSVMFPLKQLASYDESRAAWILEPGDYGIFVSDGPEGIAGAKLVGGVRAEKEYILEQDRHICSPGRVIEEFNRSRELIHAQNEKVSHELQEKRLPSVVLPSDIRTKEIVYRENRDFVDPDAEKFAEGLTQEQLLKLVCGDPGDGGREALGSAGKLVPGSAAQTTSCLSDQNVPPIVLADGPAGLRLMRHYFVKDGAVVSLPFSCSIEGGFFFTDADKQDGERYEQNCTAIPTGTALAQTWNTDLIAEAGEQIGREMEAFGVTLWLAPGMCIHRNPLCGRNFEYYSEDPVLSGCAAAAMTKGVQRNPGVGTTMKHYVCNNQEDNRMGSDSILSERALREIYLRNFEIAIEKEQPMSIMTSYNLVNGVHAANNRDLLTDVLRSEWGFRGSVMTDWTTTEIGDPSCTASGCMRAGNDMIMPGAVSDYDNMRSELESGSLDIADLRACAARTLKTIEASNAIEGAVPFDSFR